MYAFDISFEDAALIREPGMIAGLVGGEAEIHVDDDFSWSIHSITLDGAVEGKPSACLTPVAPLDRNSWLFTTLHTEIETQFKDFIEDRIRKEYELEAAE
jgi:hypothetical protein